MSIEEVSVVEFFPVNKHQVLEFGIAITQYRMYYPDDYPDYDGMYAHFSCN